MLVQNVTLSFDEINLVTSVIKENDALDSHRKGYLTFLEKLTSKLDDTVKELTGGDPSKSITVDKISLEVEFPQEVSDFLKSKLEESVVYKLKNKLTS